MIERPDKLNNQAIILASDGEYSEAIACFKRAIIIEKNNYLLWYNLGVTYQDAGDLINAKNALEKSYQIAPDNEDVIETLGTLCIKMGDIVSALEYSIKGLDVNIDNPAFWNLAGVTYFNSDNYAQASEYFEQALCINPYYLDALYNLRDTYTQMNNKIGAQECEKLIKSLRK